MVGREREREMKESINWLFSVGVPNRDQRLNLKPFSIGDELHWPGLICFS